MEAFCRAWESRPSHSPTSGSYSSANSHSPAQSPPPVKALGLTPILGSLDALSSSTPCYALWFEGFQTRLASSPGYAVRPREPNF